MSSPRKNIMLGTAGHVDHGKTALVKLLTGCETDVLAAEKERGLTIELGFAPCRMSDERIVGIVDVPGHVDFIRNMVAGAHGVDVVIFVVAADDGVMPQTREHLDILTLMGVRRGVVAVTKIDMVDADLRELVTEELGEFVKGTFLEAAPICPVSNVTGEGFEGFFEELNKAVAACEQRGVSGLFRQWIERVFTIRGFGTVVSGVASSGEVRVGDRLAVVPGGGSGRVRCLEVYGQEADLGRAGECVALNLTDVGQDELARGLVVCQGDALQPVSMVEAELRLLEAVPVPLKDYAEVHVHVGTAEAMAHVAMLTGESLSPGLSAMVQLRLARPLGVAPGERFVIRAGVGGMAGGRVTTIGGGRVLGVSNVRLRRGRPWTLASLAARGEAIDSPPDWCALNLKQAARAMGADELARQVLMHPAEAASMVERLLADGVVVRTAGGGFVHRDVVAEAGRQIVETLEQFHAANPMRVGIEEDELPGHIGQEAGVFEIALAKLTDDGVTERRGSVIALAGRQARVSAADQKLCQLVESALRRGHLAPPALAELAESSGESPARIGEIIRLLADQGAVVQVDEKVVMHREAVEAAAEVALKLFAKDGRFTTVGFRDALGVSRKFAVPLLDYFDTVHLTVRSGSQRTPGAAARNRPG